MMKLKVRLVILCISTISFLCADDYNNTFGKTFLSPRSQGDNLARRLVGEEFLLYGSYNNAWWVPTIVSVTPEYTQSFNPDDLGAYFSLNRTPNMLWVGDNDPAEIVAARDVRAEYFWLPSEFIGISHFMPEVRNVIVDCNIRFNLDAFVCGLYLDIGIPVVWTRFSMDLKETLSVSGDVLDLGLGVNNPAPFSKTIVQAYKGENGTIPVAGLTVENLDYATINGTKSRTGIADLRFVLGYNVIRNDCTHFALNLRAATPTGTRPTGRFVFEPIIGSQNHGYIGAGFSGHCTLWQDDCGEQSCSLWFEAEVHHLITAKQKRTFDLKKNGIGSRYLPLKQFTPDNAFTGTIIPAANVTTLHANVSVAAVGEALIMLDYQRCGFLFDVGYDIWGRSREKIKLKDAIPAFLGVSGSVEAITDNRTKSNATIATDGTVDGTSAADNVYITVEDIDINSAASPSALSNKVFAHLSYTWDLCSCAPFLGIGAEAEFASKNHALSQWGIWTKFGLAM